MQVVLLAVIITQQVIVVMRVVSPDVEDLMKMAVSGWVSDYILAIGIQLFLSSSQSLHKFLNI